MKNEKDIVTSQQSHEQESSEHEIRLSKITSMRESGIEPWPNAVKVETKATDILADYEKEQDGEKQYTAAGRLMTTRDHGKTFFANLQDRSGTLQIYVKKTLVGDDTFEHFKRDIDTGDYVWVQGTFFTTKTGQVTLKVTELKLLSKCLHPLPEKYHGLANVEQRYRQRYLDLMSNPESKEKFIKRSGIVQEIRNFLQTQDFVEVETPMLHPIPGGAAARPFITHHNTYHMDLYLRIAPELYLKRLVIGGIERVFEINRNFRNEGVSTKHNPEFTMLEYYMAHGDYKDGMALTEQLIQSVVEKNFGSHKIPYQDKELDFTAPFKRLSIKDSLLEIGGFSESDISEANIDATLKKHEIEVKGTPSYGLKLYTMFEECVESKIVQPTYITDFPIEVSPLAKRDANNPEIAARCELFAVGMELANMFSELNDPIDQAQRFKDQASAREDGDDEAHYYDEDYVHALEYGLPPAVGVGIGIDRLTMLLTNTSSIKDVILFPTMKIQKDQEKEDKAEE